MISPPDGSRASTLSIAMATYNGALHIEKQLTSLAQQSLVPLELVICDDGSSDETPEIIRDFARMASFDVRFSLNEARLGYRANFMKAASLCKGELIAFCDQDDVWHEDKLLHMMECFKDPRVILAHHDYNLMDSDGCVYRTIIPDRNQISPALHVPPTWVNPPGFSMVFRRSLLAFNDVFPDSKCKAEVGQVAGHDQWISYLAASFGTVMHVKRSLANYRQHGANVFGEGRASRDVRGDLARLVPAVDAFATCLSNAKATPWPVDAPITMNRDYARRLRMRLDALASPNLRIRASSFLRLCLTGAYVRKRWPLGRRALLNDARAILGLA